jgi:hypothetical protein
MPGLRGATTSPGPRAVAISLAVNTASFLVGCALGQVLSDLLR